MSKGFRGFPGGNMQGLLQQAQKMQKELAKTQEKLEEFEADGSAGGGAVKVKINGKYVVTSLQIDSQLISADNKDILEESLQLAINEALAKVRTNFENQMSKVTGGMSIPGLV